MSSVAVDGAEGVFEGLASDGVVLGAYGREGRWSAGLVALLARLLRRGGTLLDVGANIGLVGLPVAARAPARVLCFEPERDNAALLRRNAARHARRRARCFELALHDRSGAIGLARSSSNPGDHRLSADARLCAVTARRLDDVLAARRLQPPVVMKLDVQGAEAFVLRGARRTLPRVELLVVEYWPFGLAAAGSSAAALGAELSGFDYGCVLPQRGPLPALTRVGALLRSLAWVRADDPGFFDLLLVRARPYSPRSRNALAALKTLSM